MKKINVVIKKNEEKILPFVWLNGDEAEVNVHARLVGEGANLLILGIFLGTGNKSVKFNTFVSHESPRTKSLTNLRGVFKGNSSFNNDGMIRINKGAKGSDGYFASKILLFDDAKGRSVPSLEIDENELKAGHASTVGRPDEQQLFYLRSRGLTQKEAEDLIVSGFFEPIISAFTINEQSNIRKKISTNLYKL
ncbi:MAG: SufD family Fe-S cluster assembly protein [Candidatus Levybacteria bacterium]|nr:SufD family Fe-S cluster assembly protein [Candidatus Levybacteria bacterium]